MNRSSKTLAAALAVVAGALLACAGKAAVEDLEKLKEKTCSCKGEAQCLDEAKTMAKAWVKQHASARGGDQEKAQRLATEIATCNLEVATELTKTP